MNINNRIAIWWRVLGAYMRTFGGVRSHILSASDTVTSILNGHSFIRFGDGEFGIYSGKDIHYQPFSENLQKEFEAIKRDFENNPNSCQYLLGVPKKYMQCNGFVLGRRRVLVASWAQSRLFFKKHFNRTLTYGDSFLFEKKNKNIYSRIWQCPGDNRIIIFVHNNPQFAEDFSNTYNRRVMFIQCPSQNAFNAIDKIETEVLSKIHKNGLAPDDIQIVLSAGPAGKVLVYHLSNMGYHCIDAGHCWDDPLES